MKRATMLWVLTLGMLLGGSAVAQQTVKVTFLVNTATVPDTLHPNAVVQVRGDTAPLTWDGTTGVNLTNIGGDYWTGTFDFPASTTVQYKFFTNARSASGDDEHKGWENDIESTSGNRTLTTGTTDMVLALEYVNGTPTRQLQNWSPFPTSQDNYHLHVRVNMQGKEDFNAAAQKVGVRGSNTTNWGTTGNLDWGTTFFLTQEQPHGNGGSRNYNADNFYSGVLSIPKAEFPAGQEVAMKFVITDINATPTDGPLTWENDPNRLSHVAFGGQDTTIHWDWFDRKAPQPFSGNDTVTVTFSVDMTKAIQNRGFKTGDTITVQTGWSGTARDENSVSPVRTILTKQGFTNTYTGQQKLVTKLNSAVYYQYYVTKDGQDIRETFYNYEYTGSDNSLAERRMVKFTATTAAVNDVVDSKTDGNRMPVFRNTSVLARAVKVKWTVDMRPAIFQVLKGDTLFDIQGTDHVTTPEQILTNGVWINGPATGGWTTWGLTLREDTPKTMYDDGTNGDVVAGDSIYTAEFLYAADSTGSKKFVGQEFKFGINGGDNEGGKGGFGNNHIENIDDSQNEVTIHSQFGSINPGYYDAWDFDNQRPAATTVKVTFLVNTATVPDTLHPNAVVQVRGDTAPLKWDGTTGVNLTNIGGDYWTGTFEFPANSTVQYKFFTNARSASGDDEHKGWENDIESASGNRTLTTTTKDMVLSLEYVNGSPARQLQNWSPFPTDQDNYHLHVRVNMQGKEDFNAAAQKVGVRGSNTTNWGTTGDLDWGTTFFLTPEQPHGNGGSRNYNADNFYSGVLSIPKAEFPAGQEVAMKFVITDINATPTDGPLTWENDPNRLSHVAFGGQDTTIHWDWFDRKAPQPFSGSDTVTVTFTVDLTKAIQNRGFKTGDTITVQTGWAGTARDENSVSPVRTILTKQGFTNTYTGQQKLVTKLNSAVYYQYYVTKDGQDIRETFYNFDYVGSDNSLAERRMVKFTDATAAVNDVVDSKTDANRMPVFRNTSVLARAVRVTWTCDLRPAYYQTMRGDTLFDIQGTDHIWDPATVYPSGLWMNGPATGGWTTWGQTLREDAPKQMYDDGTNGDAVAGDHIYTVQFLYAPDSTGSKKFVGQEFKFGIKGGDNEGGKGGFGNNHIENIDDSQSEVTIHSQFGSINPKYYSAWDFNTSSPTSVERIEAAPVVYRLDQNYPNPFNPSTTIEYDVVKSGWVTLKVFNTLGQELKTLVSGPAIAGRYRVVFDASGFESGVYLYQLTVGDVKEVRKMTLIK